MATGWREHTPVAWSPVFGLAGRWAALGGAGGGVPGAWPLAGAGAGSTVMRYDSVPYPELAGGGHAATRPREKGKKPAGGLYGDALRPHRVSGQGRADRREAEALADTQEDRDDDEQ